MTILRLLLFLLLVGLVLLGSSYRMATADPIVRETRVALAGWPTGAPPVRAVLISDLHVAGPDMPPGRLTRIVEAINALRPDLVLIAGDLVSDKRLATRHYPIDEAVAPLAALRAPLGTFAVLGNHDHWRDAAAARAALRAAGIEILDNRAVRAGPLALAGIDDAFTGQDDLEAAIRGLRRRGGARVLLSHSPDPFPALPSDIGLMLAGHRGRRFVPQTNPRSGPDPLRPDPAAVRRRADHDVGAWRALRLRADRRRRAHFGRRGRAGEEHPAAAARSQARFVAGDARLGTATRAAR